MVVAGSFADSLLRIKLIEAVISFYLRVLRFWLPGIAMLLPLHMPVRYNDKILRNFDLKIIVQKDRTFLRNILSRRYGLFSLFYLLFQLSWIYEFSFQLWS